MRESNFAFPAQNRACVCISSQLYDRRALDTTSPLPLFNSLTHLTYLTSTSPRIREILTMDGGLERLVRLLRDFCSQPPPPESASQFYGLLPPTSAPKLPNLPTSMLAPYDPKRPFDRAAAYRFSLAFQCVVNIGVRGSEPIRARVVQAGTLDVVGCVLEAWLSSKGFAVAPSASASGMPRETREQRHARRLAMAEMRQRELEAIQAQELARALQRQVGNVRRIDEDEEMHDLSSLDVERESNSTPPDVSDTTAGFINSFLRSSPSPSPQPRAITSDTSNDTSPTSTPHGGSTPTGVVVVPGRDRSGTVVARTTTTTTPINSATDSQHARRRSTLRPAPVAANSSASVRTDTEPESDADAEMEDASASSPGSTPGPVPAPVAVSPSASAPTSAPGPTPPQQQQQQHRAVGIVGDDDAAALDVGMNLNLLLAGVDDGFVALEQTVGDDMAMGAPPGAPGNMDMGVGVGVGRGDGSPRLGREDRREVEDLTPRAGFVALPDMHTHQHPHHHHPHPHQAHPHQLQHVFTHPHATHHTHTQHPTHLRPQGALPPHAHPHAQQHPHPRPQTHPIHSHTHAHTEEAGPYREEDVLLSLQLLAYLSKYPHVRQAFYKPRAVFNPALQAMGVGSANTSLPGAAPVKEASASGGFFKALAGATVGRGKDKDKDKTRVAASAASTAVCTSTTSDAHSSSPSHMSRPLTQSTNIFSLVERFTFRPSPNETLLPSPPPLLPPEIQYWAGVIMRNACRKDESRGGIRQCANMLCGKWENTPREFAKCRRCRKAKYCGKECQSRAWAEGHRFWCSAREEEEGEGEAGAGRQEGAREDGDGTRGEGAARGRGDRVRVSVSATPGNTATTSESPHSLTRSRTAHVSNTVAAPVPATNPTAAASRSNATTMLYHAGPEPGGRGPPPGHATYTRNRVNALPSQTAQNLAIERHLPAFPNLQGLPPPQYHHPPTHAPYLHMAGGVVAAANARRRVGTLPGPSMSTTDLPGMLRTEETAGAGGRMASSTRGAGEGEGLGPDDMVIG